MGDWKWDGQNKLDRKIQRNRGWAASNAINREVLLMYRQKELLERVEKLENALDECVQQQTTGGSDEDVHEDGGAEEPEDPDLQGPFTDEL